MKILHISTEPSIRGGERQLLRIHEGVLAAGEESVILCPRNNPLLDITLSVLPYRKSFFAPLAILLALSKEKPQIIHCHDSKALTYIALIKPLLKQKVIFSRKTVYAMKKTQSARKKFSILSKIVTISQASSEAVRELYPDLPIEIIHDGVSISNELSRSESRKELGISESDTIFASVGYFTTEKNIDLLIKCADLFKAKGRTAKLLLIGDIPNSEKLNAIEAHPNIIWPGIVPNAEQYYRAFDHYLSTSTQEGLGSALLDAVIRDIPCIALNSGGSQEFLGSDDPDHCNDTNQFTARVTAHLNGEFDREVIGNRGESTRRAFSVEQLQRNHLALYSDMSFKKSNKTEL